VDLGWSLATTRARLEHRAVIIARNRRDLVNGLATLAGGGPPPPHVVTGVAETGCRTALLFPCDAGAWSGMGRRLRQAYPAFADALHEVCSQLEGPLGWPVSTLLSGEADPADARLPARNAVVLFAVEVALLRLVLSLGVGQDAVLGHGIGEVAATHAAGALALADAAALVAARAAAAPPGSAGPSGSPDCGCAELADGLRALLADGVRGFLVVGPDGGLTALVRRLADEAGRDGSIVAAPMLLPGHDERFTALRALGLLHVAGAQVDWGRVFDGVPAKRVPLPTYAFQRRRFWLAPRSDRAGHEVLLNGPDPAGLTPPAVRDGGRQPTTWPGPNLTEIVVDCVAEALRTDRGSVPLTRPLPSAGMDSLTAMDVTSRLLTLLHVNVPVSSVLLAKALPELVGEIELLLATAGARDAAAVVDAMDAGEV
jgi:acyl transferase domain-containing protein